MNKYIAFFAMALCLAVSVKSQDLVPFRNNKGLWGLQDKTGKVVTEPAYTYKPSAFKGGRSIVSRSGLKGVLNEKGKEVLAPTYTNISDFNDGFAIAARDIPDTIKKLNGRPLKNTIKGVIDGNGKEVVPVKYKEIRGDFSNGWFVKVWDYQEKIILYNREGNVFTVPDTMSLMEDRVDGKKFVALKKGKYGIIDQQFKVLLPFEYSRITVSENGLLILVVNNLYGVMDSKLKWVVKPTFSNIQQFKNGYAIISKDDKLLGAMNHKGVITTTPQFEKLYRMNKPNTSIAIYDDKSTGKQGLVDLATGKIITPANYKLTPYDYDEGIIAFNRDGKRGMMDSTGKELFYDAYDDFPRGFLDNRTWVTKDKKYGFIDKTGTLVVPARYDMVNGFSEGMAKVRIDGKCGFINTQGDLVIPLQFTEAGSFEGGLALVKDEANRSFYIDKTGKEVK